VLTILSWLVVAFFAGATWSLRHDCAPALGRITHAVDELTRAVVELREAREARR
jgi:hypothetical protein